MLRHRDTMNNLRLLHWINEFTHIEKTTTISLLILLMFYPKKEQITTNNLGQEDNFTTRTCNNKPKETYQG